MPLPAVKSLLASVSVVSTPEPTLGDDNVAAVLVTLMLSPATSPLRLMLAGVRLIVA